MGVQVLYKAAAAREIALAFEDYEEVEKGLGVSFLDEIARIERHIATNPRLYQRVDGDVRRAVMRRFPYGLFYVVDGDTVNVLACFHLHRDPKRWQAQHP